MPTVFFRPRPYKAAPSFTWKNYTIPLIVIGLLTVLLLCAMAEVLPKH